MAKNCQFGSFLAEHTPIDLRAFVRGFVDEQLGRPYDDGVNPSHSLLVFIPPTEGELKSLSTAAYRAGRLAGMTAHN